MSLPIPSFPVFETELPSTGKKIKYRPFLVKEEKVLLLAMEGEDEEEIKAAVKNILKSCIISKIKIEDLTTFDLEYIFLRIRAASAGEDVSMRVTCLDDNETVVNVTINLMDVKVHKPEGHSNKIMLDDKLGMILKYPSINEFIDIALLEKSIDTTDEVMGLLADCVDQIFNDEDVWDSESTPREEIINFIESLTQQQYEKIQNFFDTMPILRHEFKVTNPKTGIESTYTLEGLQSFFG